MKRIINLLGNMLVLVAILVAAWWIYSAMTASDKFLLLKSTFQDIHEACNSNSQCPTEEQFLIKLEKSGIEIRGIRYYAGIYRVPGLSDNEPYIQERTGDEYFTVLHVPVTDIGYYASGGKNAELIMWSWAEGSGSRIIK